MGKLKRKEKHEAELSQLEKDIDSQRAVCCKSCRPQHREAIISMEMQSLRKSSARGASTSIQKLFSSESLKKHSSGAHCWFSPKFTAATSAQLRKPEWLHACPRMSMECSARNARNAVLLFHCLTGPTPSRTRLGPRARRCTCIVSTIPASSREQKSCPSPRLSRSLWQGCVGLQAGL